MSRNPNLLCALVCALFGGPVVAADPATKPTKIPLKPHSIEDGFAGIKSGPFNPKLYIFPVRERGTVRGIPADLDDPVVLHTFLDRNQFFYQSYKCGDMPKAAYAQMEDIDEASLSPEWLDSVLTVVVANGPRGGPVVLVDSDNDEDLSDEKITPLRQVTARTGDKTVRLWRCEVETQIECYEDKRVKSLPLSLNLTLPDPASPESLYWSSTRYRRSQWSVGSEQFEVALPARPTYRTGRYAFFYVDVDHDGKFDTDRGSVEAYSLSQPFNVAGRAWRVRALPVDGSWIEFEPTHESVAPKVALNAGSPAPKFEATTLSGDPVSLSSFKGKHVLLAFWATWCPGCQAEFANITRAKKQFADRGLKILGVVCDEDLAAAKRFIASAGVGWPQVHGTLNSDLARAYRVYSFPVHFLIGPDATIVASGDELRGDRLIKTLRTLLPSG